MNVTEYLQEQKRLAEAATEGPWEPALDESVAADDWPVTSPSGDYLGRSPDDGVRAGFELADAEFIAAARTSVPKLIAAVEVVLSEHTDGGPSQGYFKEGDRWEYTSREHCCVTCGTHGEYGVEWPCPTIRAIEAAVLGGEGDGDS